MVLAPLLMAVSTTWHRNSGSVRPASSAENCTSSHLLRASFTLWVTRARISSGVRRSFFSRWMVEVPMKVWMRGRSAGLTALAQTRMSFSTARAKPQMTGPLISRAMVSTDSKSPGDEMGKPASITSTCKVASCRAMRIFCWTDRLAGRACSPSRRVVSKMKTLSFMIALRGGLSDSTRPSIRPSARPRERQLLRRMRATKAGRR